MADGIVRYIIELTDKSKAGVASATRGAQDLEKQTDEATKSVDRLGDEAAQTGKQVTTMGAKARTASTGAKSLGDNTQKASGRMRLAKGAAAAFGAALAAMGVAQVAAQFVGLSQQVADYRNDIGDAATRSSLAADTIQGLRLAAEGAGLSFEALTPGLDVFGARLSQASSGSSRTAKAFEALGVSVTDSSGKLRDIDTVFRETLTALNEMEPSAERSALAVEALGRSGGKMLQAISGGQLEGFVEQARLFGVDYGPKAAAEAGNWQRASAELSLVMRGLKADIVDTFGVGSDEIYAFTDALVVSVETLKSYATTIPNAFDQVALAIVETFDVLEAQFDRVFARLGALGTVIREALFGEGLSAGLSQAQADIAAADRAFGDEARQRDQQFGRVGEAFSGADTAADLAAAEALLTLRAGRGGAPAGGVAGGGGLGAGAAGAVSEAGQEAATVFVSGLAQNLDDTAAEFDRLFAEALKASGGLDEVGQVILESLDDIGKEARALINRQRVQQAVGLGQTFLGGNFGRGIQQVGGMIGGTAGARLGTAGAIVGGLQFIGEEGAEGIEETLEGVKDGLITALEALPDLIGDTLPRFAVSLVSALIPALIEASPLIFKALLIELPAALVDAFAQALGIQTDDDSNLATSTVGTVIGLTEDVSGGGGGRSNDRGFFGRIADTVTGRNSRSTSAARAMEEGQASFGRAEDRLSMMSTRPRRRQPTPVAANPFDEFNRQQAAQAGGYGRYTPRTVG